MITIFLPSDYMFFNGCFSESIILGKRSIFENIFQDICFPQFNKIELILL